MKKKIRTAYHPDLNALVAHLRDAIPLVMFAHVSADEKKARASSASLESLERVHEPEGWTATFSVLGGETVTCTVFDADVGAVTVVGVATRTAIHCCGKEGK